MTAPWPALSLAEVDERLTAPGAPFETEEVAIRGVPTRVWAHAPPTLAALIEQTRVHGERAFVVLGEERVSYADHLRAVATLAHWLDEQGVRPGDRVALAMRNLPEWSVAFFAATVLGAIVAPLNAWWTGAELALCVADSGARVVFVDGERRDRLAQRSAEMPMLERVVVTRASPARGEIALEDIVGRSADYAALTLDRLPPVTLAPDDDATLFYTSGTTGRPKGVLGSHRNMTSNVVSSRYAAACSLLRRGGTLAPPAPKTRLIATPLFHVTACSAGLVAGAPAGNTNILMSRWDAGVALTIIEREQVQVTGGVPTIVWGLLDHPARAGHDLSSLEAVAYGGAPCAPELARRVARELHASPGVGWGMTETGGTVCALGGEDYLARPDSCGRPVPAAELRIMDADGAGPLPTGAVGELWAKGPMVARGYWRRPDETATTFRDGWVRTGDLVRLDDDGFCTVVDRAKDVIIRGGENIYSNEVEHVLCAHPAVVEAALIGLAHPTLGEEPAAVVHLAAGMDASEQELQDWTRGRLAAFKTPVAVRFAAGPLPRNAGGKIVKSELRTLFAPDARGPTSRRNA